MTTLTDLYEQQGQSPWLDNMRRDWLQNGTMAGLVAQGIRGITSNPTIFAKAISGQDTYDEEFRRTHPHQVGRGRLLGPGGGRHRVGPDHPPAGL